MLKWVKTIVDINRNNTVNPIAPYTTELIIDFPTMLSTINTIKIVFIFVYMLDKKEQQILLELLQFKKLKVKQLLDLIPFDNDKDCFRCVRKLERWNLIHGSKFWHLTFKGKIRSKLIALDKNNPKDYTKNLKSEIVEFEYIP